MAAVPNARVYAILWASVYSLYIQKAEKKGRTKAEVDYIICWLTGYDETGLKQLNTSNITLEKFYCDAPNYNPNALKIKGLICGYRVEEIDDPIIQKIRHLDKLIDELAKGRAMHKILRE